VRTATHNVKIVEIASAHSEVGEHVDKHLIGAGRKRSPRYYAVMACYMVWILMLSCSSIFLSHAAINPVNAESEDHIALHQNWLSECTARDVRTTSHHTVINHDRLVLYAVTLTTPEKAKIVFQGILADLGESDKIRSALQKRAITYPSNFDKIQKKGGMVTLSPDRKLWFGTTTKS